MAEPTLPRWATSTSSPSDIVEPAEEIKDDGWNADQRPPYEYANWLAFTTYEYLVFLKGLFTDSPSIRSDGPANYTESTGALVLSKAMNIKFADGGTFYTNQIAAGTLTFADGQVLVIRPDTSAPTVVLTPAASYAAMVTGEYFIMDEGDLDPTKFDEDYVIMRRVDTSLANDPYGVGFSTLENLVNGDNHAAAVGSTIRFYFAGKDFGPMTLHDGKQLKLYSDNGVTQKGVWDSATGDLSVASTAKISLNLAQTAYWKENSANNVGLYVNGLEAFNATTTRVSLASTHDLWLDPTKRLYFDGGIDTFITEGSLNVLNFVVGAIEAFNINSTRLSLASTHDLWIDPGKRLYLDGGVGNFLTLNAANTIAIFTNSLERLNINTTRLSMSSTMDFWVDSTKRIYTDGGAGCYMTSPSTLGTDFYADNVLVGSFINLTGPSRQGLAIPTTKNIFMDGGAGTDFVTLDATGQWRFVSASSSAFYILNLSGPSRQGVAVPSGFKYILDGLGGVNWIDYDSGGDNVRIFNTNSERVRIGPNSGGGTGTGGIRTYQEFHVDGTNITTPTADTHVARRSLAKAWGYYKDDLGANPGNNNAITLGFNVLDIDDDDGDGLYVVTLSHTMTTATYCAIATAEWDTGLPDQDRFAMIVDDTAGGAVARSTSQFTVLVRSDNITGLDGSFNFAVFGALS